MIRARCSSISKRCYWSNTFSQSYRHIALYDQKKVPSAFFCDKKTFSTSAIDNIWESGKGLLSLLTDQQRTLLVEQKHISRKALDLAKEVGGVDLQHCATSSILEQILTPTKDRDAKAIADRTGSKEVLDSTFTVVIAGEFNAGKSTLINALLGQKFLESGALPTTDQITILTCDQSDEEIEEIEEIEISDNATDNSSKYSLELTGHSDAIILHRLPISNLPLLGDLTIIDTPGTNAIMSNHTERTLKLLPSADLILFVTSADRPFPESERKLLQSIQSYRKNIVIIINKMDVLDAAGGNHGEEEKRKVAQFVADNAADLLGARAVVMPISAKDALSAKLIHASQSQSDGQSKDHYTETSKVWKRSNFSTLEKYLKESLSEETKIQAKLLNPLGVTEGMLKECTEVLKSRRKNLETDTATVNLFKNQMDSWKKDMGFDMNHFQNDVSDFLGTERERCRDFVNGIGFIERHILLFSGNTSTGKLEEKWNETRSITMTMSNDNVKNELLKMTRECSDSIATSSRAQGQAVIEYLGKRPAVVGQNLIGSVTAASRFEDTRKDLSDKMGLAVDNVFASYDEEAEKRSIFESLNQFGYISACINTLAISSGISTALEVIDIVQGGAATCILAIAGTGIIPLTNQRIIKEYENKWKQRDDKLQMAFESFCSKEIERIHQRILKGVSPYTRYVKAEEESIDSLEKDCDELTHSTQILRNRIVKLR